MSVNSVNDDPNKVCSAFLQFEREQGNLHSYSTMHISDKVPWSHIKVQLKSVLLN